MKESTGVETVRGLSLKVRAGEIYGVAGVDGNGQRELIYGITGLAKKTGQVIIEGEDVSNATPKQILDKSVAHIPEDRRGRGLVLQMPIRHNLVLDTFDNKMFTKGFFMTTYQSVTDAYGVSHTAKYVDCVFRCLAMI